MTCSVAFPAISRRVEPAFEAVLAKVVAEALPRDRGVVVLVTVALESTAPIAWALVV